MPATGGGAIDRAAVVSAVERYLASRGIAVAAPAASPAPAAPSCGCAAHPDPAPPAIQQSVVANVAAQVVAQSKIIDCEMQLDLRTGDELREFHRNGRGLSGGAAMFNVSQQYRCDAHRSLPLP